MKTEKSNWLNQHIGKITRPARRAAGALLIAGQIGAAQATGVKPLAADTIKASQSSIHEQLDEIAGLIEQGKATLKMAGKKLVELMDAHPEAGEMFLRRYPELAGIGGEFVAKLEQVGRDEMAVEVLFIGNAVVANLVEALPYEKQVEALSLPHPIVKRTERGEHTEFKRINEMSQSEGQLRFKSGGGIRTEAEQHQVLEERAKQQQSREDHRWWIYGDTVEFLPHARYRASDLEKILGDLKAAEIKSLGGQMQKNQIR